MAHGNSTEIMASWPTPDYVNPPTRPPGILITSIVFSVVAIITLVLRLYTRIKISSTFGPDDIFMIIATFLSLAMFGITCAGDMKFGWNRHIWDIPKYMFRMNRKLNMVYMILFSVASAFTKLSLLWFCRRLVGNAAKFPFYRYYLALMFSFGLVCLCTILFVLLCLLQCRPLKAIWDLHRDYPYHCFNGPIFIFSTSILNSATDLLCTLLPMALIMKLRMRTRQKIAVSSIFAIGIVVNIVSGLRIYFFVHAGESGDATWNDYATWITGDFEIGLGLIATNAPPLRPLFAHYMPRILSFRSYTRTQDSFPTPMIFGSAPRPAQPPRFNIAASDKPFDCPHAQALSVVTAETGKEPHVSLNGIEVTRMVELEAFRWEPPQARSLEDEFLHSEDPGGYGYKRDESGLVV